MRIFQVTVNFAAAVLGFACTACSSFFLMGYLFNRPGLYTYPPSHTPVGLPVAILFMLLGVAIIILSMKRQQRETSSMTLEEECRFNRLEVELSALRRDLDAGLKTLPCQIQKVIDSLPCQKVEQKIEEVKQVLHTIKPKSL